ncbi:NUDIX hydrolase [Lysinibacillus sp. KU-BSD001]|uniref:NUDIX hydrolase n=1 Tax=Lysinibacillus sp. KU-BSD001 TaxID=3141328 RepID=UPI0036E3F851
MWQEQLMNYQPFNEQEMADKQIIMKCLTTFDEILTRENEVAHMTCSGFVVNKARTKVLMVHHNIYNSWSWTGGHADGETDFLAVALREVQEETGVSNLQPVTTDIFSLDVLTVIGHVKKGKFISPHLHLNVTYLIEADDAQALTIAEAENSGVAWLPINQLDAYSTEEHMKPIYHKIINKMKA